MVGKYAVSILKHFLSKENTIDWEEKSPLPLQLTDMVYV
jgi:hypothetical protein